jgi:hypothetical protein
MSVNLYESWIKSLNPQADWRLFDYDSASGCLDLPTTTTAYNRVGSPHGSYENGVTIRTAGPLAGRPNYSATFNGVDRHVNCGNVANQTTNDFSIIVWVKPTIVNGYVISKKLASNPSPGYRMNVGYYLSDFQIADGLGLSNTFTYDATLSDAWYQLVAVRESGVNIRGYVNGVASGTPVTDNMGSITNAYNFQIGLNGTTYYSGSVARVTVVQSALTAAQIAEGYRLATAAPQRSRRMTAGSRRMALLHGE